MGGIFISYRREDTTPYAGRLWENLRAHFAGTSVFIDLDSLSAGVPFAKRIQEAIGECSVLIALIGRSYVTSVDESGNRRLDDPRDFVRLEVTAALRKKVPVIPVLVGGATLPRRSEMPKPMAGMLNQNAIEITDQRWRYDVDRLITAVEALSLPETPTPDTPVDARAGGGEGQMERTPRRHRRPPWIAAWIGLAAVVILGSVIIAPKLIDRGSPTGGRMDSANELDRTFPCVQEIGGPDSLTCLARISASDTAPPSTDNAGDRTTFKATNALDGFPDTAWRAEGDASGETVRLTFPVAVHVLRIGLIPGYAKTDPAAGIDRFVQNRKVVEVRYEFDDGTTATQTFTPSATMQYISVDVRTRTIIIRIVRTAPGHAFGEEEIRDFTPISEIDVLGQA